MSKSKLRIGIIGIGWKAVRSHVPHLLETGKADLVAICRRNKTRLQRARTELGVEEAYTDWHEMLEQSKLDAVIVCTPNNLHAEPTIAALEQGLHVLVEKPMALISEDARTMVRAAERNDRVLMVGYDDRLRGCWREAKKEIENDAIGRVRQINVIWCIDSRWFWNKKVALEQLKEMQKSQALEDVFFSDCLDDGFWRKNPIEMGGGFFVDVCSHVMDLMLWLSGSSPVEVVAFQDSAGLHVDCFVTTQVKLSNNAMLSLTYGEAVRGDGSLFYGSGRMTIFGDCGILTADWDSWNTRNAKITVEAGEKRRNLIERPDVTPASAFVSAILEGKPNPVPGREAAYEVVFAEAAYRSIAEKRIISIQD